MIGVLADTNLAITYSGAASYSVVLGVELEQALYRGSCIQISQRISRAANGISVRPSPEAFPHTSRPVVASYEPGERWAWCYVDETELPVPEHILPVLRD